MAVNPFLSSAGSMNLGISGNQYGGSNPYLEQNIDRTLGDVSRNYNMTIAPQRAGAMAASGSFGNSGQQQMQLEDQRNFGQTLANTANQMRSADYGQQQQMYQWDQGNQLANRAEDNRYDLGLRDDDYGYAQLDANINDRNFNNQLAGANFGLNAYTTLLNNNNLGLTAGTQIHNTPLDYQTQFSNAANAAGGLGGQQSMTMPSSQGSPLTGALAGLQLYNAWNKQPAQNNSNSSFFSI